MTPIELLGAGIGAVGIGYACYRAGRQSAAAAAAVTEPVPPPVMTPRKLSASHVDIEAMGDPALLVDAGSRVIASNSLARDLFGIQRDGEDLRLMLRHPAIHDIIAEAAKADNAASTEVSGIGAAEGAYRVRAVKAGDGRILISFADVTQARLTERMRVDFVANASHELRTPLATLVGFIETLLGPAADDSAARRRFLDIMASEASRMARLIDDLLSLSRIELDKYIRPQSATPLAPLVADVARTLAMRLESDERQLQIDIPADLPDVIADRDQILQVLHNLISNAQKYGRTGTPITVTAVTEPGLQRRVRISVSDRGDGIASEFLPRLTERFYRVDTSRSRSLGGTGLGLAIAKHIVERHRGVLEIASEVGQGTRVSFTLPTVS